MFEIFAKTVYAAGLDNALLKINYYIINPLIRVMFTIAFAVFVWGIIQYFINRDSFDAKEKGRLHMQWGLIGLTIMTSVFFIIRLITNTLGLDGVNVNEGSNTIDVEIGQVQTQ